MTNADPSGPQAEPEVTIEYVSEHEVAGWIGHRVDCSQCGHLFHGASERGAEEVKTLHMRNEHGYGEPEGCEA